MIEMTLEEEDEEWKVGDNRGFSVTNAWNARAAWCACTGCDKNGRIARRMVWKSEGTVEIALAKCEIRRRVVCVREELLRRVDAW